MKIQASNYRLIILAIIILTSSSILMAQSIATPDGYAGSEETTGGGNTAPVVVFTTDEFRLAVSGSSPAVVIVQGRLDLAGDVSIGSNKTVVGANASSGLYGGGVKIQGSNYIIQNLIIGPHKDNDAMEVSGAKNVFIHKCEFYDGADGNLDIVRASDYVTVSWCKFYYVDQTNHKLSVLIGNGDEAIGDEGKLHVTMHHCWFAEKCQSRMPRVRYGHVHIYNNYYSCEGNNYCIGTGFKSHVRVENSYFDGIRDPWDTDNESNPAQMGWDNLKFIDCTQPSYIENSFPVFDLPYSFNADQVEVVKSIVRAGAGNIFSEVNNNSPKVTLSLPLDSAKFITNSDITFNAEASSDDDTIANVNFYSDSLLYTDNSAPYSFTWENVKTGKYYFWATATSKNENIAISKGITVFVGSNAIITQPANGTIFRIPANINIEVDAWDGDGNISMVKFFQDATLLNSDSTAPYSYTWDDVQPGTYILKAIATDNDNNTITTEEITVYVSGGPEGFEYCSSEGDECVSDKLLNIAYGADSHFNYLYNVTGTTDCSSEVFGDPIPNVPKACYAQEAPTPYVALVYPASGKIFQAPAKITLYARAVDNDGTIDSIKFYQNDNFIAIIKVSPNAVTTYTLMDVPAGKYIYTANVTDNDGKSYTSEAIDIIVEGGSSVDKMNANLITLYPNPVSGKLILNLNNDSSFTLLTLFDSEGKIIQKGKLSGSIHELNVQALQKGIYFVALTSDHGKIVRKIIKQ